MYPILQELLSDKTGGRTFVLFGPWHWFWIGMTILAAAVLIRTLGRGDDAMKKGILDRLSGLAFGLYILDFFLMPLAYGQIDVEKLPFHACTAMCVMCFLSRRSSFWGRFRGAFAVLGFVSNVVYLVYPAGVMWQGVHPLCYRVIQTLGFHGLMTAACLLSLIFEGTGSRVQNLAVTAAMTLWAMVGNFAYNSQTRLYNWFFVVRDPFGILPEEISSYVMPVLNIVMFFAVELAVCAVLGRMRKREGADAL